jgi:DNA-binding NarL/FixJ family response regulator
MTPAKISAAPRGAPVVRVLTVDDHALFRSVARDVVDATPGFETVGEAVDGEQALTEVARLAPDLVLLDVRMPGLDGVDVALRLRRSHPAALIVLMSVDEATDLPTAARLDDGVRLVRKQDFGSRLLQRLWSEHDP